MQLNYDIHREENSSGNVNSYNINTHIISSSGWHRSQPIAASATASNKPDSGSAHCASGIDENGFE
jgi:hypothetical protein